MYINIERYLNKPDGSQVIKKVYLSCPVKCYFFPKIMHGWLKCVIKKRRSRVFASCFHALQVFFFFTQNKQTKSNEIHRWFTPCYLMCTPSYMGRMLFSNMSPSPLQWYLCPRLSSGQFQRLLHSGALRIHCQHQLLLRRLYTGHLQLPNPLLRRQRWILRHSEQWELLAQLLLLLLYQTCSHLSTNSRFYFPCLLLHSATMRLQCQNQLLLRIL